jgi:hypothetical protein
MVLANIMRVLSCPPWILKIPWTIVQMPRSTGLIGYLGQDVFMAGYGLLEEMPNEKRSEG